MTEFQLDLDRPVTYGVVGDGVPEGDRPPMQIVLSVAEECAMLTMAGGVCLFNWLRVHGLANEPFRES